MSTRSTRTDQPHPCDDPGGPFAQAMYRLDLLEATCAAGGAISEDLIGAWFPWLAAQLLVRRDEQGQQRLWDCWAQFGIQQEPTARPIGRELVEELEAVGALDQYGAEGVDLLRRACSRLEERLRHDGQATDSASQALIWAFLHLTDRRWWAKLQDGYRSDGGPVSWRGQESHIPQRLGRILTEYLCEHAIGGSFRPAVALSVIRSFMTHGKPDDTSYRNLVQEILTGGPNAFLPAATLPLILRMAWISLAEPVPGVDKAANENLVFQTAIGHLLEKRPNDADLLFAPRASETWEKIVAGQILGTTVEPHFHNAWDQRWATGDGIPDPTGQDGVDHMVALYADRIIRAVGLEDMDRIPEDRRSWLMARLRVLQQESAQRQQGAKPMSVLKQDIPAIRVLIEREDLKHAAGISGRQRKNRKADFSGRQTERPRHKM